MTVVEVNRFLNSNEKQDRDKTKKHTKIDHKTSERLITQVLPIAHLATAIYKVPGPFRDGWKQHCWFHSPER